MAVGERERRELQEALMATIGPDHTDTLLGYLPPVGWADVATKQDLHAFAAELRGEMAELRGEIGNLRAEMHHQLRVQFFWMVTLWVTGLGLLIGLHSTTVL